MSLRLDEALAKIKLPFTPAPMQLEDIEIAAALEQFAFLLDVGCGKTFSSTVVAIMWDCEHTVIVGPPIMNDEWESWLKSIGLADVSIFRGPKRTLDQLDHKWVIMSHAIFRDSFVDIKQFYNGRDVAIIIDEAQALKNPQSKLFKYVNQFRIPDRKLLMLSATPTSKPEDTYTYMKLKTPELYRSYGHWQNLHVGQTDPFGKITKYENLDMLAERFALKTVKRTKAEVFGHDKTPIFQPIPYSLSPKHLKLYNKLAEEQLLLLPAGEKIDATTAQKLRHALQQIVVNFEKFSGNPDDRSTAYDLIDATIEQVDPMDKSKSKLVIWTYYQVTSASVTAYLVNKFGEKAVAAAYGKVDSNKAIKRIMNDDECRFLVAQPGSCGVGLNLQHVCSENLFIEMSTSPMQIRQAMGRTDRAGQKVRPTMRFGQAIGTIQLALFADLLRNDDLVSKVERSPQSLRNEIFGRT